NAGPLFGLTPKRHQSAETHITGPLTRARHATARTAPYEAPHPLPPRPPRFPPLPRRRLPPANRPPTTPPKAAAAPKPAGILHRMWIDGSTFRWTKTEAAHA